MYWYADHIDLLQGNRRHALTAEDKLAMRSCKSTAFPFLDMTQKALKPNVLFFLPTFGNLLGHMFYLGGRTGSYYGTLAVLELFT